MQAEEKNNPAQRIERRCPPAVHRQTQRRQPLHKQTGGRQRLYPGQRSHLRWDHQRQNKGKDPGGLCTHRTDRHQPCSQGTEQQRQCRRGQGNHQRVAGGTQHARRCQQTGQSLHVRYALRCHRRPDQPHQRRDGQQPNHQRQQPQHPAFTAGPAAPRRSGETARQRGQHAHVLSAEDFSELIAYLFIVGHRLIAVQRQQLNAVKRRKAFRCRNAFVDRAVTLPGDQLLTFF